MPKNTGKSFEKITQEIYQAFCDFDTDENGFKKLQVQHNVKIQGQSGAIHQIDVFWQFNIAGVTYNTLVEVKDWKSPVEKEQILSFKAKINDIHNSNGIFVSRTGFQEGAKTYAKHTGIQLITLTENKNFEVLLSFVTTNYEDLQLLIDVDDLKTSQINLESLKKSLYAEKLENIIIIGPDMCPSKIFDLMCIDAKPYYYEKDNIRHHIKKDLMGNWQIISNLASFPQTKIYGYSFRCYNTREFYMLSLKNLPIICIKDILKENEWHYNKETKSLLDTGPCYINV